ncbi:DUF2164 domain-containing protein [Paenibacillus marinisediminis]
MHIQLTKEQREQMVQAVQQYFELERDEVIGELAAEQFMNFMMETVGDLAYNQALKDTRAMLADRFMAIEDELYAMERHPSRRS